MIKLISNSNLYKSFATISQTFDSSNYKFCQIVKVYNIKRLLYDMEIKIDFKASNLGLCFPRFSLLSESILDKKNP